MYMHCWVYCLCGRFSELSEANIQILQTVAPHLSVNGLTSLAEVMVARIISCESEDVMATNGKYRKCETRKFYLAECLTLYWKIWTFVHVELQDGGFIHSKQKYHDVCFPIIQGHTCNSNVSKSILVKKIAFVLF